MFNAHIQSWVTSILFFPRGTELPLSWCLHKSWFLASTESPPHNLVLISRSVPEDRLVRRFPLQRLLRFQGTTGVLKTTLKASAGRSARCNVLILAGHRWWSSFNFVDDFSVSSRYQTGLSLHYLVPFVSRWRLLKMNSPWQGSYWVMLVRDSKPWPITG